MRGWRGPLLLASWLLAPGGAALAHEVDDRLAQHRLTAEVGRHSIDVFLEVELRSDPARLERQSIDADGDGSITPGEEKLYLRDLLEALKGDFAIRIAGDPRVTLPLFHPELDLQGESRVGSFPLRVRLSFFTRTPQGLSGAILIQPGISRWQPASHEVRARGRDGMEAWALPLPEPVTEGESMSYQVWGQTPSSW